MQSARASARATRSRPRSTISRATRPTPKPGHQFTLNAAFDDVDASRYDALAIAGGRAPEYLRLDPKVISLVREFAEAGKPIAAICHAAQLLAAADVIRGKRISAYPACAPEVKLAGGEYADIPVDAAVTDAPFVTAPAWPRIRRGSRSSSRCWARASSFEPASDRQ